MKHRARTITAIASCLAAVVLISCADSGTDPDNETTPDLQQVTLLRSQAERDTAPQVSPAALLELSDGNTAFACDLYRYLSEKDGNLFFSPYSISLALAMLYAGTEEQTETQVAEAMHFTLAESELHPAFNFLDLELSSRGDGAMGADNQPFRLRVANSVWGQDGYSFQPDYLDLLATHYGAGMNLLDFMTDPEAARVTINQWVSDSTEGRIPNLLPQGSIDMMTRMVLTNAIYFNASWDEQFEEERTASASFTTADGTTVNVPFMNQTTYYGHVDGDGFVAVGLPYDGLELSMVVIMPDTGSLAAFESNLNESVLSAITDSLAPTRVQLSMPKFTIEGASFSLSAALQSMGMIDAFLPGTADLSGIDGTRTLYVSDVIHKAFVAVDEKGTEAAAATGVIISGTSMPPPPVPVVLNRPFLFLIRDIETKAVLFLGRVVNPNA